MKSWAEVLNHDNRALLHAIKDSRPQSFSSLQKYAIAADDDPESIQRYIEAENPKVAYRLYCARAVNKTLLAQQILFSYKTL